MPSPGSPTPPSQWGGVGEVWLHRRLLLAFVLTDLKNRYVGSSIGFFWTVVTPLLELVTYTFVFHGLIGVRFQPEGDWVHYALFLFCGMVTWLGVSDAVVRATPSIKENAHLIKKVNFPSIVLPAHMVASAMLNQSLRLFVLIVFVGIMGPGLSWHLLLIPPLLLLQHVFTLGLGLFLSTMNVYFRDTAHWVNAGLLLWMFVTPIFYPAAVYPKRFILLLQLNPLAHMVGVYQELILNQRLPHPHSLLVTAILALFSVLVGYSIFSYHRERFADLV